MNKMQPGHHLCAHVYTIGTGFHVGLLFSIYTHVLEIVESLNFEILYQLAPDN